MEGRKGKERNRNRDWDKETSWERWKERREEGREREKKQRGEETEASLTGWQFTEQPIPGVQYILEGTGSITDTTKIPVEHSIRHKHTLTPCLCLGLMSPWREKMKGRGNPSSWLLFGDLWVKAVRQVLKTNWVFVFCALNIPVKAKYTVRSGDFFKFQLINANTYQNIRCLLA